MFLCKLKFAGVVLLAVTLGGTGAGLASHRVLAGGRAATQVAEAPSPGPTLAQVPVAPPAREKDKPAEQKDQSPATATSPDGKLEATAEDKSIVLTDVTGKVLNKLQGHTGKVTALAFSPDGKTLASGSADQSVRLWDVATGKETRRLQGKDVIASLSYSADGRTLTAKEGEKGKRVWDVATGKEVPQPPTP
jgi:hypothetical protein